MGMTVWVALFALSSALWAWVLFLGGADWLEGSWLASLFIHARAVEWTAEGIKLFAGLTWFFQGVWFAIGLFAPGARPFGL